MRWIAVSVLTLCSTLACAESHADARLLLRVSFVAGLQHYAGKRLFSRLRIGDELQLRREPDNAHDENAIRVEWHDWLLGYLPRDGNESLARQMDRGNRLRARIVRLNRHRDPDRRIEVEIYLQY